MANPSNTPISQVEKQRRTISGAAAEQSGDDVAKQKRGEQQAPNAVLLLMRSPFHRGYNAHLPVEHPQCSRRSRWTSSDFYAALFRNQNSFALILLRILIDILWIENIEYVLHGYTAIGDNQPISHVPSCNIHLSQFQYGIKHKSEVLCWSWDKPNRTKPCRIRNKATRKYQRREETHPTNWF